MFSPAAVAPESCKCLEEVEAVEGSGSPVEGMPVPSREELPPLPGPAGWEPSPDAAGGSFGWAAFSLARSQNFREGKGSLKL